MIRFESGNRSGLSGCDFLLSAAVQEHCTMCHMWSVVVFPTAFWEALLWAVSATKKIGALGNRVPFALWKCREHTWRQLIWSKEVVSRGLLQKVKQLSEEWQGGQTVALGTQGEQDVQCLVIYGPGVKVRGDLQRLAAGRRTEGNVA